MALLAFLVGGLLGACGLFAMCGGFEGLPEYVLPE